jgi:pyrimidine-nucleoside phosphorylase
MTPTLFPQHIIAKKRDGETLTAAEIQAFVRGATDGSWADYQLSAMLMAIFLRGMTKAETVDYTSAMMHSGRVADLEKLKLPKADKHSTGGVGDKVSLHLAPMLASCGVAVPMISGRGLGHTGGTLDKLESIAGFRVNLSLDDYRAQLNRIGLCLIGQTAELAPADKKLYALRDVTGTVESIPLICGSILAKKLAEGIDVLVLDVKFGRGAFMPDKAKARELAQGLVEVANALGKPARAILTAMEEPLGRTVGNALEVAESIACLRGEGPADTMAVTYALGEQILMLTKVARSPADARAHLQATILDGGAMEKFVAMVEAQGGDPRVVADPGRLPQAKLQVPFLAAKAGCGCHGCGHCGAAPRRGPRQGGGQDQPRGWHQRPGQGRRGSRGGHAALCDPRGQREDPGGGEGADGGGDCRGQHAGKAGQADRRDHRVGRGAGLRAVILVWRAAARGVLRRLGGITAREARATPETVAGGADEPAPTGASGWVFPAGSGAKDEKGLLPKAPVRKQGGARFSRRPPACRRSGARASSLPTPAPSRRAWRRLFPRRRWRWRAGRRAC